MDKKQHQAFHYDAFISYRHLQPDQFVAENLHKMLEAFRLPENVVRKIKKNDPSAKTRITRVFRDQEELPLSSSLEDPIVEALQNSDFLIVICSPRLKESEWCKKEIRTFIEMHGSDRVLAILAEGEPEESFPEELLWRKKEITGKDGKTEVVMEKTEPLAADFRGGTDAERKKAMKAELLRLLAPMFGLNYDELRQRHREQKMHRVVRWVSIAAVLCLIFALCSTYVAIQINKQKEQIQSQSEQIQEQSLEIADQAQKIAEQFDTLRLQQAYTLAAESEELLFQDDRVAAIDTAIQALTTYQDINMPYTDEAKCALQEALNIYEFTDKVRSVYSLDFDARIQQMTLSPDGKTVLVLDINNVAHFLDVENDRFFPEYIDAGNDLNAKNISFLGGEEIGFISRDGDFVVYNFVTEEEKRIHFSDNIGSTKQVAIHVDLQKAVFFDKGNVLVYDMTNWQRIAEIPTSMSGWMVCNANSVRSFPDNIVGFYTSGSSIEETKYIVLFDVQNNRIIAEVALPYEVSSPIYFYKNNRLVVSYEDSNSHIKSYDVTTGSLCWELTLERAYISRITQMEDQGKDCIVLLGAKRVYEIDAQSSQIYYDTMVDNNILFASKYSTGIQFITSDLSSYYLEGFFSNAFSSERECYIDRAELVLNTGYGMLVVPENESRVIVYRNNEPENLEDYNGPIEDVEMVKTLTVDEILILKEELDIPDVEIAQSIIYSADEKYMLVCYPMGRADLYRTEDMECMCGVESKDISNATVFIGNDAQGNYYFASAVYGYCFSPEGNYLGCISFLRAIDVDANCYIIGATDLENRYRCPIYTVEELTQFGEEYISHWDIRE
ncbi:MAG: toll/interleukin-1 receptor domain-containing protein [Lachnospiraceae bacterium]